MNLDIYEAIDLRRTVRDFKAEKIEIDVIKKIIAAGLKAPTNNHQREWEFIVINDKTTCLKVIDPIAKNTTREDTITIIDQWGLTDPLQREMYLDAIPKQHRMLLTAGCLILPCFRQKSPLLKPANLSALNSFASIWCCIENMLLAAASEGIYGVTRIPFDEEITHVREVLKMPEDYEFPCYLALGYPREDVKPIAQNAIPAEERIHFNKW